MSKKLTHTLCAALAAGALAAVPALSAAEGEGTHGREKQEGQSQQGQQQQQGSQQQGRQGQEGQQQQQQHITKRMTLNESMTLPLTNGCSYTATINGTVTPAKKQQQQQQQKEKEKEKSQAQGQAQKMDPNLRITASVICPNQATLQVSENVTLTGPLTHDALEEAIERRGTIFTQQQGRHCAFVPDFRLSAQGVQGVGVAYMCAIQPGQGQQQQGG